MFVMMLKSRGMAWQMSRIDHEAVERQARIVGTWNVACQNLRYWFGVSESMFTLFMESWHSLQVVWSGLRALHPQFYCKSSPQILDLVDMKDGGCED